MTLKPSDPAAAAMAGFIGAPFLSERWASHYHAEQNDNPLSELIDYINMRAEDLEQAPALVQFMRETTRLLYNGLHQHDENRKDLAGLCAKLDQLVPKEALPKRLDLPAEYQKILDMLEKDTGQRDFRPIGRSCDFIKYYCRHIWAHIKQNPNPAIFSNIAAGAFLGAVYLKGGSQGTRNYDPMVATNASPEMGDGFAPVFNYDPAVDTNVIAQMIEPSCHEHVSSWGSAGQWAADKLGDRLPQECDALMSMAQIVQDFTKSTFDAINIRIGELVGNPVFDLGSRIFANEEFTRGFERGIRQAEQFWYGFNTYENIALHGIITYIGFQQGRKLGRVTSDEVKQNWQKIHNFTWRSVTNTPVAWVLGAGGAVQSFIANQGWAPEVVCMGVGGAVLGNLAHKTYRWIFNREAIAKNIVSQAPEALQQIRQEFSGKAVPAPSEKSGKKQLTKGAIFVSAAAGYTALYIKAPELAGNIAGKVAVTVAYGAYNIPEDLGLHVIFGGVGGMAGFAYGAVERLFGIRNNDDDDSSPPKSSQQCPGCTGESFRHQGHNQGLVFKNS